MLQGSNQIPSDVNGRALAKHLAKRPRKTVTYPFELGFCLIAPSRFEMPSRRMAALALFNRVSWSAIRKWRAGTRKPPLWAIDTLRKAIRNRVDALEHVDALLAAEQEKGPVGPFKRRGRPRKN